MNTAMAIDIPLDWDAVLGSPDETADLHTDSIPDALILSLHNKGRVDIEYIMSITGEGYRSVIKALRGAIFQNPDKWDEDDYRGFETAEEYLSGNLRRKLTSARRANKLYPGRFGSNITAIKKLLGDAVGAENIYVTLGSPWVPTEIIDDFIGYILGMNASKTKWVGTKHDEFTGTWEIPNKSTYAYWYNVASRSTYGTMRVDALEILEKTLNMKTVSVYDEEYSPYTKSGKKRVLNKNETTLALAKQQKLIDTFRNWVWIDEARKEKLETIFENRYGCIRRRVFDGSFLTFPGMSKDVVLYPYQKNAVARILFSPNTLLAHDVGSGKTYVMIAAGMELIRMGLSKKNLYVVPNNIVLQWKSFFESIYPSSRVFCVEPKQFTPEKRENTLKQVRDGDYDAVIMAYSCFDRLPLSKKVLLEAIDEKRKKIAEIENSKKKITSALKREKEKLGKAVEKLLEDYSSSAYSICFDDLGVTRLFVDEAHNYKNVPLDTGTDRVLGISSGGSKKCKDMMDKVQYIQKLNDGGGVILATGTPITNSLTDAFIMQKYLQNGELAMLDLHTFDGWIGMFAEKVTEFEVDVDTSSYRLATRFARFHNLPELTALLSSVADFHQVDKEDGLPDFSGYTDCLITRSEHFSKYLKDISKRAEKVRAGKVRVKDDNMLKITTDGRKAALDIRLVEKRAKFSFESKVAKCAANVFDIYTMTKPQGSSQLVFCDSSTPKLGFNVYDELKRILLDFGVPTEQIAFVHDADTEAQRAKLFKKVRNGEVRILVGSTFKLGMGVNVQDKLVAIHHLDLPWRPADMTQREGRILRQGNENKRVFIYRYITEGSFDAYSWQLLETKQRFISELLSGSLSERSGSDVDDVVLSYAEVKALAIGNPLVKERVEAANELTKTLALRHKAIENHIRLEKELLELPAQIERQTDIVRRCRADAKYYKENVCVYDKEARKELRERLAAAIDAHLNLDDDRADTVAMNYQGFDVILPANVSKEKPHVWLAREGRYFLELGDSSQGALIRIDNFLEKLSDHLKKLNAALGVLRARQVDIEAELLKKEDYTAKIERLNKKIARIDEELGVKKI